MTALPSARSEAISLGERFYFTGKPCKHGHLERRHIRDGCLGCERERRRRSPSRREAQRRRRRTPAARAANALRKKRKLERIRNDPAQYSAYLAKRREQERIRRRKPERRRRERAKEALREQRVSQATPKWADRSALISFMASKPEGYHLDHIIPLRGEFVSGLHVLENLQFIPAEVNIAKSNKVDPETLECAFCRLDLQPNTNQE